MSESSTADTTGRSTLRVPAAFAAVLLDEFRRPLENDDEDPEMLTPEQRACDAEVDANVRQWISELDGNGGRTLTVPDGRSCAREWLHDQVRDFLPDCLTHELCMARTATERERRIAALSGWSEVVAQLDEQGAVSAPR